MRQHHYLSHPSLLKPSPFQPSLLQTVRPFTLAILTVLLGCGPSGVSPKPVPLPSDNDASPTGDSSLPGADGPRRCGPQTFGLQRMGPPEVLIVLDRSTSMIEAVPGQPSRWEEITSAVIQVTKELENEVYWGLAVYPQKGTECSVGGNLNTPLGFNNSGNISIEIARNPPADPAIDDHSGNTPTAQAVQMASIYMQGRAASAPRFILLATDGLPNCGASPCTTCGPGAVAQDQYCVDTFTGDITTCPDPSRPIQAIAFAASVGVETFVVGINTEENAKANEVLNGMASAGKRPRTGSNPLYYPVNNKSDLVNVMKSIGSRVVACEFPVATAPYSAEMVEVFVGNDRVPRDATRKEGWDFGANNLTISFHGSWCTRLQQTEAKDLHVNYKCPDVD